MAAKRSTKWVNHPIYKVGFAEGKAAGQKLALDLLQQMYFDPAVTRSSERGLAVLEVVRELSEELKNQA